MNSIGLDGVPFSEILLKLGFSKDFYYSFELVTSDEDKMAFSFFVFSLSDDKLYDEGRMYLYKTSVYGGSYHMLSSYQIKIFNDDYEWVYYLYKNKDGFDILKKEDYIKEDIDDKTYMRRIYDGGFRITINKNLFFNEIRLVCEKYDVSEVNNELELKEYLLNIDDGASINEVYKKICEISLGNEIDYRKINLSLYKGGQILSSISYNNSKEMFCSSKYEYEIFENEEVKKMTVGDTFVMMFESVKKRDIEFRYKEYRIEIGIRPFDQKEDNDKSIRLRDYLIDLKLPVMIDKLCNDICERFLVDIDSFSCLKVSCYYKNKLIDMMHIENGKLVELELNRDGKIIKIDRDGNFLYECNSIGKKHLVKIKEDRVIGYETYMDSGIENDDMGNVMYSRINQAKDEKVKTRKLVDRVLKKG